MRAIPGGEMARMAFDLQIGPGADEATAQRKAGVFQPGLRRGPCGPDGEGGWQDPPVGQMHRAALDPDDATGHQRNPKHAQLAQQHPVQRRAHMGDTLATDDTHPSRSQPPRHGQRQFDPTQTVADHHSRALPLGDKSLPPGGEAHEGFHGRAVPVKAGHLRQIPGDADIQRQKIVTDAPVTHA